MWEESLSDQKDGEKSNIAQQNGAGINLVLESVSLTTHYMWIALVP